LKAVNLVGDIIALPGSSIAEAFQPVFSEYLKRLTDRDFGVRMSVLEHVKSCLLSNPFGGEAPQIICESIKCMHVIFSLRFFIFSLFLLNLFGCDFLAALCDRLLDFDENVRKQVVAVICDVARHVLNGVPLETVKLVAERLRDKSVMPLKYKLVVF
jgi:sister-chromatid-cohesion protein PDS5